MKIEITSALHDTQDTIDELLPDSTFVPRVGDIIYFGGRRYVAHKVIIDYDNDLISIYVKDYL